jgi:hypothetical protein
LTGPVEVEPIADRTPAQPPDAVQDAASLADHFNVAELPALTVLGAMLS